MKDTQFFNTESIQYSKKRYPEVADSYLQFFFNRRLAMTKAYLRHIFLQTNAKLSLLEVGCADGVIIRALEKEFPTAFEKVVGIDIAAEMVAEAERNNVFPNTTFLTRDKYQAKPPVDIVVETGVINYASCEEEFAFAQQNLKLGGYYLFSIAGTDSLYNRLKNDQLADFRSYKEYTQLINEQFVVLEEQGCGFFIPLIWRLPALARIIQSVADPIVGRVLPWLCHEKLYLVQKK
jgi:cyclopropane fatty-acyl-phospholipid synthase-like methyltransferase